MKYLVRYYLYIYIIHYTGSMWIAFLIKLFTVITRISSLITDHSLYVNTDKTYKIIIPLGTI